MADWRRAEPAELEGMVRAAHDLPTAELVYDDLQAQTMFTVLPNGDTVLTFTVTIKPTMSVASVERFARSQLDSLVALRGALGGWRG